MINARMGVGVTAVGAILLIGAVVGFVVVPEHQPSTKLVPPRNRPDLDCSFAVVGACRQVATGLSRTAYDGLRIATWTLLIVGALAVAIGLIRYARLEAAR